MDIDTQELFKDWTDRELSELWVGCIFAATHVEELGAIGMMAPMLLNTLGNECTRRDMKRTDEEQEIVDKIQKHEDCAGVFKILRPKMVALIKKLKAEKVLNPCPPPASMDELLKDARDSKTPGQLYKRPGSLN